MFDWVWSGKRHVMMGATQVDRYGNQNIAAIGDYAKPKAQLLGFRGAPGNTINDTTSYWVPNHCPKVFVRGRRHRRAASATTGPPPSAPRRPASTRSAGSSPTSACSTSRRPTTACGCARCTRA